MTMTNMPHITRCGLPGIDLIPFGMHACHFYGDRDQLAAAVVSYSVAGLRSNERCLWITAPPLPAHDAVAALRGAWDGVDDPLEAGALRVLDAAWLKGLDLMELCLAEEERALADGYTGLRIAGNTHFLTPDDWSTFVAHERAVTARFNTRRIVTLCSYARAHCEHRQMSEVMHAHHCALEGPDADGQVSAVPQSRGAASAGRRRAEPGRSARNARTAGDRP